MLQSNFGVFPRELVACSQVLSFLVSMPCLSLPEQGGVFFNVMYFLVELGVFFGSILEYEIFLHSNFGVFPRELHVPRC